MNHPPTYVRTFLLHKVRENCHFLDHPPTPISLRNIKMAPYSLFQLRPPGYSCRPAENECDLSELCTGQSGECPADLFVKNLVECNQGQGYCFNGQCPTMRSQCKEVWGHKASPGDKACYQKFNMGGTQSGNCGTRPYSGGFKPCEIENIACGTLHCQEGSSKPRIPGRNDEFVASLDYRSFRHRLK